MEEMLFYDRMQFAFDYFIFSQLTMGLSLIIVYFKWKFLKQTIYITIKRLILDEDFFALNFAMGGDGIPMEFQFGTIGLNFQN
jgi:cytochrome d ubiquinol oxidase subunit I